MQKTDLPDCTLKARPNIDDTAFIANGAQIMGDVRISARASIWYNAVLRGDINYIKIGQQTNIQDGCIIHLENELPCVVGANVTIGHGAILHGCTIEDECLIGMGAIILSGAIIKRGSMVAAGSLVRERDVIEPLSLMVGTPARCIRTLPESTIETHQKWAEKYFRLSRLHMENMEE